jgi:hypothetical protein
MVRGRSVVWSGGGLLLGAALATGIAAQEQAPCLELDRVQYSEPRQLLVDRIAIEPGTAVGGRFPALRRFEEVGSPHGTARALVSPPDFSQPGPWTTVLAVRGNLARPLELLITVRDHGSGGVTVRWLNERLLWMRVWWGRIVASELLLDVETARSIYYQEADFRQTVLPCEEKRLLLEVGPEPTPPDQAETAEGSEG